jgi:hypothetical protein
VQSQGREFTPRFWSWREDRLPIEKRASHPRQDHHGQNDIYTYLGFMPVKVRARNVLMVKYFESPHTFSSELR